MKRVALYVRVSTAKRSKQGESETLTYDQNPEVQEKPLRELARQRGWHVVNVYSDRASVSNRLRTSATRDQIADCSSVVNP